MVRCPECRGAGSRFYSVECSDGANYRYEPRLETCRKCKGAKEVSDPPPSTFLDDLDRLGEMVHTGAVGQVRGMLFTFGTSNKERLAILKDLNVCFFCGADLREKGGEEGRRDCKCKRSRDYQTFLEAKRREAKKKEDGEPLQGLTPGHW